MRYNDIVTYTLVILITTSNINPNKNLAQNVSGVLRINSGEISSERMSRRQVDGTPSAGVG